MKNYKEIIKDYSERFISIGVGAQNWVPLDNHQEWEAKYDLTGLHDNYQFPEGVIARDVHNFLVYGGIMKDAEEVGQCFTGHSISKLAELKADLDPDEFAEFEAAYDDIHHQLWAELTTINPELQTLDFDQTDQRKLYEALNLITVFDNLERLNEVVCEGQPNLRWESDAYKDLRAEIEAATEEFNYPVAYNTLLDLKAQIIAKNKPLPQHWKKRATPHLKAAFMKADGNESALLQKYNCLINAKSGYKPDVKGRTSEINDGVISADLSLKEIDTLLQDDKNIFYIDGGSKLSL